MACFLAVMTMRQWIEKIAAIPQKDTHNLFAIILWNLWKGRNALVFENKTIAHEEILRHSLQLREEILPPRKQPAVVDSDGQVGRWLKPPMGYWKINIDAAIRENGEIGIGAIVRDDLGKLIVCRCLKLCSYVSAEAAEGVACQEGVSVAREYGGSKIILETDCKGLYQKLVSSCQDLSSIGVIVKSIHTETSLFESIYYSWVRRTGNKAAHLIASLPFSDDIFNYYTGRFPDRIVMGVPSFERYDF